MSALDVSHTRSLEGVSAADWRGLALRAGHVFATREWLLTWWRHYGKAGRPLIGLARRGGEPTAIVPLYVWWQHGLPVLRFAGHGPSDQLGPVCAPLTDADAATAVAATIDAIPLRRFVLIAEHLAGDQGFAALTGARPLYHESSPVLRLGHGSWDEFLQARGRNFRQQARRFPRKLGEFGTVSYRLAADPDRLQRDMDTLFRLHGERWAGAETAFLKAAPFHREFAAQALREGWLRLRFLEIDGRPVAALYGFRFAGAEWPTRPGATRRSETSRRASSCSPTRCRRRWRTGCVSSVCCVAALRTRSGSRPTIPASRPPAWRAAPRLRRCSPRPFTRAATRSACAGSSIASSGVAGHDRAGGHVAGDHRSGPHQRVARRSARRPE